MIIIVSLKIDIYVDIKGLEKIQLINN